MKKARQSKSLTAICLILGIGCVCGCAKKEEPKPAPAQPVAQKLAPSQPASQKPAPANPSAPKVKAPESGLPPGKTTKIKTTYDGKTYHYNCYVPASLKVGEPVVVVLNTSPEGDAQPFSKPAAEELGWVMVGLVEAKNGPGQPIYENMAAAVEDLAKRFLVQPRGLIFAGFSGGARSSFFFGQRLGSLCGGIIAIGAGSQGTPGGLAPDIPVFFIAGETDFNKQEVTTEASKELHAGRVTGLEIHPGGHSWGPPELRHQAVQWIAARRPAN